MYDSGIYIITNEVNKKVYIGQSKSVLQRIIDHKRQLSKNKHHLKDMQNDYTIYGKSNFSFKVLEYCSLPELDEKEIEYILKYNATNKEYGYNIYFGGGCKNKRTENLVHIGIGIPLNLKQKIFEEAKLNDRSISNYVRFILENRFEIDKLIKLNRIKIVN
jgi:group I intron endonuclease